LTFFSVKDQLGICDSKEQQLSQKLIQCKKEHITTQRAIQKIDDTLPELLQGKQMAVSGKIP
jgi:hypothetical protein